MSAETWGIVLRDRATGAEQWVACEVTQNRGDYIAASMVAPSTASLKAWDAVEEHGRWIARNDPSLMFVGCEKPAAYAAHMERERRTLAIDEANDLRAEVTRLADTIGAIGRSVGAESCERDVILAAIRDRGEDAFRRGAEAMREAAARACYDRASALDEGVSDDEAATNDEGYGRFQEALALETTIRALPLSTEAAPPPAQSHEAPATPDVPLSLADAAARARSAAAQRAR